MGLEPTTFCMAIVSATRMNACFCGLRLNRIAEDCRRFARFGPPMVPRNRPQPPEIATAETIRTVRVVPRISFFYGIAIFMYWNEGVHARPHFHARYSGNAASIDLSLIHI